MKKILNITILILLLSSCQKLEENLQGSLVNDVFFRTESDLDAAVTAIYSRLVSDPWNGFGSTRVWVPLMGADDLTTLSGGNKQDFKEFDLFAGTSQNGAMRNSGWRIPYSVIYAANNVIGNYQKVSASDPENINKLVAQARFLRAFSYFWIVRIFGEIPLITTVEMDYNVDKSPVKDVYDLIIADLTYAKQHLPPSWQGAPGRPTVWSAKSLLAQVYLTMGGWPLKDEAKYALAASEAKDVIDHSPHDILPNFADIWPLSNENNKEIVWAIQFCSVEKCNSPYYMTHGGYTTMPSEESGWDDVFFELGFYKRFPEGIRKNGTFHTQFTNGVSFEQGSTKHPYIAKYRDGTEKGKPSYENDFMTSRNMNYLRFAEVLLIYAEAQAMADGAPNAEAYKAINRVRFRAGLNDLVPGLGKMPFRDSVVAERGWELAAEFSRWFDLVRTEKVETVKTLKDPLDMKIDVDITKKQYQSPIPDYDVLLNPKLAK
ncbi:RagB/SusD family nutrient uptake outer membrane protein [Chitinophaga niabensis]|uniref:Starch-binding associating with outer membrane n=1 Tax=Chitinophaga niabensis TaxID=536979 RepID=A0A1N6DE16_9BACT|nr:RagB/SusD family nutrient uptake outer membrane protein [Chitinophaga niabensis]SIN68957.1 Starch-binding associating with outer membrane [Chitinophaga niabensis]